MEALLDPVAKDGGVCGSQGRGSGSAAAPAMRDCKNIMRCTRYARLQQEQHKRGDYKNINALNLDPGMLTARKASREEAAVSVALDSTIRGSKHKQTN